MPVVEVDELSGYFHNLLAMYVVADDFDSGEPLIALIQWHWNIFNEDEMSEDSRVELLEEIANADWDDDDGEPMLDGRELYRPLGGPFHTTHRERWEEFCSNVREHPEEPLPFDEFFEEELSVLEVRLPIGTLMRRSRRGYNFNEHGDRLAFQGNDIGSPPAAKASAGRANRAGQQVLYCADEEKTAIAEGPPPTWLLRFGRLICPQSGSSDIRPHEEKARNKSVHRSERFHLRTGPSRSQRGWR